MFLISLLARLSLILCLFVACDDGDSMQSMDAAVDAGAVDVGAVDADPNPSPEPETGEPEAPEPDAMEPDTPVDERDRTPLAAPSSGSLVFDGQTYPMQPGFSFAQPGDVPGLNELGLLFQFDAPAYDYSLVWVGIDGDAPSGNWGVILVTDDGMIQSSSGRSEMFDFIEEERFERIHVSGTLTDQDGQMRVAELRAVLGGGAVDFALDLGAGTATLTGTLGGTTLAQMQYLIDTFPEVHTLVLANIQGSENDEINLQTSRLVRASGLNTQVPMDGEIYSGGVDLFCAGVGRAVAAGAKVGVHSWAEGGTSAHELPPEHPQHVAQVAYFTEMLGPENGPAFYWFTIEAAPAEEIHLMTPEEIERYMLVTP